MTSRQPSARCGDRLWGLHACENDRGVPGGGLVPWEAVFGALQGISFRGYLVLETYNSSLGDFAYRRGIFQNVCPDGAAFVRQGLGFLREQWARSLTLRRGSRSHKHLRAGSRVMPGRPTPTAW